MEGSQSVFIYFLSQAVSQLNSKVFKYATVAYVGMASSEPQWED